MDMNAPVGATPLDRTDGIVGQPLDRVDGRLKVTGGARYAYEVAQAPRVTYGYIVEATIGHGRITAIDSATASAMPGVLLILTHENAPTQGSGNHHEAHPVLTGPEIAYYGQPVACVVAESFEEARDAAYALRVTYETAPGVFTLADGRADARTPGGGNEKPDTSKGDFDQGFASSPVRIDVTYTTPLQTHAMMEPHATLALWDGDSLILHTSNQMLNRGQAAVARTLHIPKDKVRLISPYIGGGFGSKLWINADAILAAIAARQLRRPVKIALTRQQIFHVTTHRSDTVQHIRIGADKDGRIEAISHDVLSGNLRTEIAYESAANQTRTLYAGANRETRHRLAALDIPVASSMRAPGEAVGLLALECAMDELAEALRIDPIELRICNEPKQDPEKDIPYSSRHLVECLQEGARRFGWNRRQAQPAQTRDGNFLVGMGVAAATRNNPLMHSTAYIRLDPSGRLDVRMAMTDIGTGTYTILTQIAAEMMGLPPERISVGLGDTDYPVASGSGGSFGAASSGSALYEACMNLRSKFAQAAGFDPNTAEFARGVISNGRLSVPLVSLAGMRGMDATGEIAPGAMKKEYSQQSYGAHFAEVGVDRVTGEIRLRRMLGVFTAGRVLNAKTARSQAIGGMIFGVGAALEEAVQMDGRYGCFVNKDLAEYHVAVHADVPDVDAVFLPELDNKTNPLKSKGVGELGICGAGAAVANAIYNACGVRVRDYPVTLDKVLGGLPLQA